MKDETLCESLSLPRLNDRVAIVGRNGSGKSHLAAFFLSEMPLLSRPHYLIDYKGEALFNSIRKASHTHLPGKLPTSPGLHMIHVGPGFDQEDAIEDCLWQMWRRGDCSITVDESYMLPDREAYRAVLTQGRSKNIQVFALTQRPVFVPRFVFSEANSYAVFALNDRRDRQVVATFMRDCGKGEDHDLDERLKPFWFIWYDCRTDKTTLVEPCPQAAEILEKFDAALTHRKTWI
jgi:hypothetical protein